VWERIRLAVNKDRHDRYAVSVGCPVLAGDIEARSDDEPAGTGQHAETAKRQRPSSVTNPVIATHKKGPDRLSPI